MKIVSPFKDYYDYVAHIHGGGDPKIVYTRKRIGELITEQGFSYVKDLIIQIKEIPNLHCGYHYKNLQRTYSEDQFDWLIVCGKGYPLVTIGNYPYKSEILDPIKHANMVKEVSRSYRSDRNVLSTGIESPLLIEMSKIVGHPIFIYKSAYANGIKPGYTVTIDGSYPIAEPLGLASIYPAEQLYQDLSYFIVNKMKDSPDMAPPTVSSDKEKINQHGFDVRQSFRHRK